MKFIGIDIGSTCAKTVVMNENKEIILEFVQPTGWSSVDTAEEIRKKLVENDADPAENVCVATGYGRVSVPYADKMITEITCHAMGAVWIFDNKDMTIIDIGGQDTKIICVEQGFVKDFMMNDKCSAGTGRFLEIMANTLSMRPNEMCELAREGSGVTISSMCTVFAAQANRMSEDRSMLCLTGGLCECSYISEALTKELVMEVKTDPQSRYAGAIGAALGAVKKGKKN